MTRSLLGLIAARIEILPRHMIGPPVQTTIDFKVRSPDLWRSKKSASLFSSGSFSQESSVRNSSSSRDASSFKTKLQLNCSFRIVSSLHEPFTQYYSLVKIVMSNP